MLALVCRQRNSTPRWNLLQLPRRRRDSSYYRARYYDPTAGRFLSEDPTGFMAGMNFYAYVTNNPIGLFDPLGLTDWNEQQTQQWLQNAYNSATAGRIRGLLNIEKNSTGDWDFGWSAKYHNDTWTVCGKKMNADQFGNYIAGFQGGAYDRHYFNPFLPSPPFLPPGFASSSVGLAGLYFHITGKTKATDDKFDTTGAPDVLAGIQAGLSFKPNSSGCGCSK
jgi:RHS repeat-associated protein